MNSDQLARLIMAGIAEHQSRGLVDDARGLTDVVVHGRVDLVAVATDLLVQSAELSRPARRSWAPWFAGAAERRRRHARLAERAEHGAVAEAAIARLRLRDITD